MTCLVKYLSNNVNIVSPQLTISTFHSNHDFSNIKWNVHYSLHSFSEYHSGGKKKKKKQFSNNFDKAA